MSSLTKVASLRVSAIVHATEDSSKVIQAIGNISQVCRSVEPEAKRSKGHYGNQITTLALMVKNPKAADGCLRDLWSRLTVLDTNTVFFGLGSRVDTSGTMFLRVDKQCAYEGTIRLQDSDPIKVSISFKISRARPDGVANEIRKFLTEISPGLNKTTCSYPGLKHM